MYYFETILELIFYIIAGLFILIFTIWCFVIGGITAIYIVFPSSEFRTPFSYDKSKACKFEKGWFEMPSSDLEKSKECFKK
jgi:hypothetical protein